MLGMGCLAWAWGPMFVTWSTGQNLYLHYISPGSEGGGGQGVSASGGTVDTGPQEPALSPSISQGCSPQNTYVHIAGRVGIWSHDHIPAIALDTWPRDSGPSCVRWSMMAHLLHREQWQPEVGPGGTDTTTAAHELPLPSLPRVRSCMWTHASIRLSRDQSGGQGPLECLGAGLAVLAQHRWTGESESLGGLPASPRGCV